MPPCWNHYPRLQILDRISTMGGIPNSGVCPSLSWSQTGNFSNQNWCLKCNFTCHPILTPKILPQSDPMPESLQCRYSQGTTSGWDPATEVMELIWENPELRRKALNQDSTSPDILWPLERPLHAESQQQ